MTSYEFQLTLVAEPPAAARARRALGPVLRDWQLAEPVRDDVALVLTELVANAVRHARAVTDLEVSVVCRDDEVVVCVRDGAPDLPAPRHAGPDAESGRGFTLIDALARRWWVDRVRGGKCVSVALARAEVRAS